MEVCAKAAQEQGVSPKDFKTFICEFSNNVYPHYEEASGSGNIKAPKVQMRLRVMFLAMCQYFGWKAEAVRKPFAEEIPLYPEGFGHEGVGEAAAADPSTAENSELPSDVPADDVSAEDAPNYGVSESETAPNDGDMDREDGAGVVISDRSETDGGDD